MSEHGDDDPPLVPDGFLRNEGVEDDDHESVDGGEGAVAEHKQIVREYAVAFPRLPQFSGDNKDVNFDLWKYEVRGALPHQY